MVPAAGLVLVGYHILVGVALVDHAPVERQIETLVLDKGVRQIVQIDLAESADEQAQHTQGRGAGLIGKDLVGEKQIGALLEVAVAVNDAPDAVARGLECRHGVAAVAVEDHAEKTVDELMVLQTAVLAAAVGGGRQSPEFTVGHVGKMKQTGKHLLTDISIKSFGYHRFTEP